jgi:hypothetical protein
MPIECCRSRTLPVVRSWDRMIDLIRLASQVLPDEPAGELPIRQTGSAHRFRQSARNCAPAYPSTRRWTRTGKPQLLIITHQDGLDEDALALG